MFQDYMCEVIVSYTLYKYTLYILSYILYKCLFLKYLNWIYQEKLFYCTLIIHELLNYSLRGLDQLYLVIKLT